MEPAVADGSHCLVNCISPYFQKPKLGKIIIFSHENVSWISRVVALENDIIEIKDKAIFINKTRLKDTHINRNWTNWHKGTYAINQPFKVPEGHVFVLSDNLDSKHDDSRVFGPIQLSAITGKVW